VHLIKMPVSLRKDMQGTADETERPRSLAGCHRRRRKSEKESLISRGIGAQREVWFGSWAGQSRIVRAGREKLNCAARRKVARLCSRCKERQECLRLTS
jgi:hypothetical protein